MKVARALKCLSGLVALGPGFLGGAPEPAGIRSQASPLTFFACAGPAGARRLPKVSGAAAAHSNTGEPMQAAKYVYTWCLASACR